MSKSKVDFLKNVEITSDILYGYNPKWILSQQYVLGEIIDGELFLLYEMYPPQLAPISDKSYKYPFRVFVSGTALMSDLASVLHHSSLHHKTIIEVYALSDFIFKERAN